MSGTPNIRGECPPYLPWLAIRRSIDRQWRDVGAAFSAEDREELLSTVLLLAAEHYLTIMPRYLPGGWPASEDEPFYTDEEIEAVPEEKRIALVYWHIGTAPRVAKFARSIVKRSVADLVANKRRRQTDLVSNVTGKRAVEFQGDVQTDDEPDAPRTRAVGFPRPAVLALNEDATTALLDLHAAAKRKRGGHQVFAQLAERASTEDGSAVAMLKLLDRAVRADVNELRSWHRDDLAQLHTLVADAMPLSDLEQAAYWADVQRWAAERHSRKTGNPPPKSTLVLMPRDAAALGVVASVATLAALASGYRPCIELHAASSPEDAYAVAFETIRKRIFRNRPARPAKARAEVDCISGGDSRLDGAASFDRQR